MNEDEIKIEMKKDGWQEIDINGQLSLLIRMTDKGYSFDLYRKRITEDTDGDFLEAMCASWENVLAPFIEEDKEDDWSDAMQISDNDYDMYI